jgi:hypothetical protein
MLPENEVQTFISIDTVVSDDLMEQVHFPQEYINSITPTGMPPHVLNLKVGCIVMLLRNINAKLGLCNGTRLKIMNIHRNLIESIIISGKGKGTVYFIPKINLITKGNHLTRFVMNGFN